MGLGINNNKGPEYQQRENMNFLKFANNWLASCMQFQGIPFLAQTLIQMGPPPSWLMPNSVSLFANLNFGGNVDSFQSTTSKANTTLITDKFDKLYNILNEHAKTLTEKEKATFDERMKDLTGLTSSEKTSEKFEELLNVFEYYQIDIKKAKVEEKNVAKTNNSKFANLSLDNLKTLLEEENVLDIISSWNSNDTTKSTNILSALKEKYDAETDATKKDELKKLLTDFSEKLADKAYELSGKSEISSDRKEELEGALDDFEAFEVDDMLNNSEFEKAFNNLYKFARYAEAEIAEAEIEKEFDFLGDKNPVKKGFITNKTKSDVKDEGLSKTESVEIPDEDEEYTLTREQIDAKAEKQGLRKTEYEKAYYSEKDKKHYYYDEDTDTFKELKGVTRIYDNGRCVKNRKMMDFADAVKESEE